jgi:hypothetical protein
VATLFNCFTGSNRRSRAGRGRRVLTLNRKQSRDSARAVEQGGAVPVAGRDVLTVRSGTPARQWGRGSLPTQITSAPRRRVTGASVGPVGTGQDRVTDGRRRAGVRVALTPRRTPRALRGGSSRLRDGTDGRPVDEGPTTAATRRDHAAAGDRRVDAVARLGAATVVGPWPVGEGTAASHTAERQVASTTDAEPCAGRGVNTRWSRRRERREEQRRPAGGSTTRCRLANSPRAGDVAAEATLATDGRGNRSRCRQRDRGATAPPSGCSTSGPLATPRVMWPPAAQPMPQPVDGVNTSPVCPSVRRHDRTAHDTPPASDSRHGSRSQVATVHTALTCC